MPDTIAPYPLPPAVKKELLELADRSDLLLFGELHGTQEVPRVVAGLLPDLVSRGYGGIGLEVCYQERQAFEDWAHGRVAEPPSFFAHPGADGRGSVQALALIHEAVSSGQGWPLLCFDIGPGQPMTQWAERDGWMARNFTEQHAQLCPTAKMIGICGSLHSRLVNPGDAFRDCWPSFASQLQQSHPELAVNSVEIIFHSGAFFNMEKRDISRCFLAEPEIQRPENSSHTLQLHLPEATPVTFLAGPFSDF